MSRPARTRPRDHSTDWPNRPCTDTTAETARQLAINLTTAIDQRSLRTIGELTGVNYSALSRILTGDTWPDLATITKLEHGLNTSLYPPYTPTT